MGSVSDVALVNLIVLPMQEWGRGSFDIRSIAQYS